MVRAHRRPAASHAVAVLLAILVVVGGVAPIAARPADAAVVNVQDGAPTIAHTPVPTAYAGRQIPIQAGITCTAGTPCTARLYYRTPSEELLSSQTLGGGWTVLQMVQQAGAPESEVTVITFDTDIPASDVTTRGVDYFIEAEQGGKVSTMPGVPGVSTDLSQTYWHIHVVNPPLLSHVPPAFAPSDRDLPLTLRATCSTNNCRATMFFRTTDGPVIDEPLFENPDWPSVEMSVTATEPLPVGGNLLSFGATIPAQYVDTRGVDYFFHVTDGTTNAWWPGTSYEGYYAPVDGMRTGWHHVHVVETPHIAHVMPSSAPYRQPISIDADANCPATRTCSATVYYRTTQRTVVDPVDDFVSAAMTVSVVGTIDDLNVVHLSGVIPAEVVDTRGVDYFFSISDGSTTTWWPGTSSVDGYAPVEGLRVGYAHIRVLEPPHIVHVPVGATQAFQPLPIEATINCATETCSATLHYTTQLLVTDGGGVHYTSVSMAPVSTPTPTAIGAAQRWSATIPLDDVTTRGLAYFIEASDGYTRSYAPGTDYWGAYVPIDGQRAGVLDAAELVPTGVTYGTGGPDDNTTLATGELTLNVQADMAFPVRVLEPPHPAHVPVGKSRPGSPVRIEATSNCAAATCSAVLAWQQAGGQWAARTLRSAKGAALPSGGDLWQHSGWIPSADAVAGLSYRIEVTDGYATESTPTYPVVMAADAWTTSVGGDVWADLDGDATRDAGEPGASGARIEIFPVLGPLGVAPTSLGQVTTDSAGEYAFVDLPAGSYVLRVTEHPSGAEPLGATTRTVTLAVGSHVTDADFRYRYTGSITGTLTVQDGAGVTTPLPAAQVRMYQPGIDGRAGTADDQLVTTTQTDSAGAYTFAQLPPADYWLEVAAESRPAQTVPANELLGRLINLAPAEVRTGVNLRFVERTAPASPAGSITARPAPDLQVAIHSNGGIAPWQVQAHTAAEYGNLVGDILLAPAYDITIPDDAPAFDDATITFTYDPARLPAGFNEQDIRIYHFDEEHGLWMSAGANQTVDPDANTVTAAVEHFSVYAPLALGPDGWARYWASRPQRCVPVDDPSEPNPVTVDLALVLDESLSMQGNDPTNARLTESKNLVDRLASLWEYDRVGVISFSAAPVTRIGLTPLVPHTNVDAVKAAIDATTLNGSGTNITDAVAGGLDLLTGNPSNGGGIARVMILLTDGEITIGPAYPPSLSQQAVQAGVVIHTVGLGSGADNALLQDISSATGGVHFSAPDAAALTSVFSELGPIVRDDGTDSDADHLSDCEEKNGMLATSSFYTASAGSEADSLIVTDPQNADTDGDGLSDGEEMRGLLLSEPFDLRDFPGLPEYAFLVEAGITRYYPNHADPRFGDTDGDQLPDFGELHGLEWPAPPGATYTTNAVRWDTDNDGASDWMERQLGTDPLTRDPNELGIPGLPRFTLFQPDGQGPEPIVDARWLVFNGELALIDYNRTPVTYDGDFNCISNCEAIEAVAAQDAQSGWKCLFVDCTSAAERERAIVKNAVAAQVIFTQDGDFRGEFFAEQGYAECIEGHANPGQCSAPSGVDDVPSDDPNPDAFDFARDVALDLALGTASYEPRDLCGDASTPGGVYHLVELIVDPVTNAVTKRIRYVGETNDFAVREAQHNMDPIRGEYKFEPAHQVPDREVRRGLEQRLYNDTWGDVSYQDAQAQGSLNKQRPMRKLNPRYGDRMNLAQRYLDECLP